MLTIGILGGVVENLAQAAFQIEAAGMGAEVVGHVSHKVDVEVGIDTFHITDGHLSQTVAGKLVTLQIVELLLDSYF